MQIERLLKIIMILLNRENVTASMLAKELEVSVRTIYRDLDVLSLAGIPVYTSRGRNGGIRLLSEFTLSRAMLSPAEQEDMMTTLQGMKTIGGINIDSVLDKMGALFKNSGDSWLEVDLSGWENDDRNLNKFAEIRYAIVEKKVIEFSYSDSCGKQTNRCVEPFKLVYKGSGWYMISYCKGKEGYRNFKLSRMNNVRVKSETFDRERPDNLSVNIDVKDISDLIKLKLRFQKYYAYRVYDDFAYDDIVKNEDGTMEVTVWYPRGEWVYGYVMSYGEGVEVLEPEDFKREICHRFEKAYLKYRK